MKSLWAAVACVIGQAGCSSAVIRGETPDLPGQRARIEVRIPDQPSWKTALVLQSMQLRPGVPPGPGEPPVEITLTNTSNRTLWVNRHMYVDTLVGNVANVRLDIMGPSGKVPHVCKRCGVALPDYIALRPGDRLTTKDEGMWGCYRFDEPGEYVATVTYRDQSWDVPPPPEGADYLPEAIVGEPVHFRVVLSAEGSPTR